MLWFIALAHAQFTYLDTRDVPVARVLANLKEREKVAGQASPYLDHAIARLEATAAVLDTVQVRADLQWPPDEAYWGPVAFVLPWASRIDVSPLDAAHLVHLNAAIERYRGVVAALPDDPVPKLGLGWCLLRAGDRAGAIPPLRAAATAYWTKAAPRTYAPLGPEPAAEAAAYLLLALDPVADAAEIADLRARVATLGARQPHMVTPIVVPLVDQPLPALVDSRPRVRFDLDGSGVHRWGWPGRDAAWLVWDPREEGRITSGTQLFGAVTWWVFWPDGYAPLAALDDDGDGRLVGAELAGLALWNDRDQDGRSDPGEVRPLAEWGVVALGARAEVGGDGVLTAAEGVTWSDGRVWPTWDWIAQGR